MEKRKHKIGLQLDAIEEEKKLVNENIQCIVNQISSYKENPDLLQPKDYPVLFSYELDVLKKLTEINFELESLIEAYPLKEKCGVLKTELKKEARDEQIATGPNLCDIPVGNNTSVSNCIILPERLVENVGDLQISEHDSLHCITDADVQAVRKIVKETSAEHDRLRCITDADIQAVRETVKEMSAKLGISQENMSAIKNYYEKPSISHLSLSNPSTSRVEPENSNQFEVPEKDAGPSSNNIKTTFDVCNIAPFICSEERSVSTETELSEPLKEDIHHGNLVTYLNVQNSDKSTTENSICSSSAEQFTDCVDFLSNECDSASTGSTMQKIQNTAIEKLNNYMSIGVSGVSLSSSEVDNVGMRDDFQNQHSVQCSALKKLPSMPACSSPNIVVSPNIVFEPTKEENCVVVKNFQPEFSKKKKKCKKTANCQILYDIPSKEHFKDNTLCAFSHIENPSEMADELNEFYKKEKTSCKDKESAFKSIGRYCAVYIGEYNSWYRAEVLDWHLESKSENVEIQLVDYGKKRVLTYKNLRTLTKDFAQLPKLATKCHFPLIYPPGSTELEKLSEWPAFSIDAFIGLSGLEGTNEDEKRIYNLVYASFVEDLNSVAVDLIDINETDEEKTVGQILIDLHMVAQIIPSTYENINEAVAGYDARDEARICRFTKSDGTCFKGKNCKLEHILLPKDGFTTDKEAVFKEAMYSLTLPKVGDIVTILITAYIDSCNFFANIVRAPFCSNTGYVVDNDLEELMKSINTPSIVRTYRNMKILPAVGEIVLVHPPTSKKWFRAIVRSSTVTNPHNGESKIEAVHCYLDEYKFKKNCDKLQCKDFFTKNFYFHNFGAIILSSSLPLKIQLTRFDGINVGDALVRFGFAERTKYDINPKDDCPIALS
nr:unnamed protein product [Callosobruchus chinensis]